MDELNGKELGKISATMEFLKRDIGEVKQDLKNVPTQIAQGHDALRSEIKNLSDSLEKHYVSQDEFQPIKKNYVTQDQLQALKDRQDTFKTWGVIVGSTVIIAIIGALLNLILKSNG